MPRYSTKLKPKPKKKPSLMPLWLTLIGLGLVFFAGWALLGGAQSKARIEVKGAPRLKVEKDTIDHGRVKLGAPIYDTIRITNVGDQPLIFAEAPYIEIREGC